MKNLIILFIFSLAIFSCQKEEIKPEVINQEVVDESPFVSFNDIFGSGLDSVYVFENDVFTKKVPVGCGNTFKAKLSVKYSFKKEYKNSLIPLYGHQATTDTYLIFLTTNTKPKYCIDYVQEGLSMATVIIEQEYRCSGVHYTLNAWF
jgi:hypothetical protein